jgi:small RNA 2'-O-methyltransferase
MVAYLILKSTNPNLSYVISKNPNQPLLAKPLRKGFLFGWFDKGEYICLFRDRDGGLSYSDESYDYLDSSSLGHPQCYLNILGELFDSLLKKGHEEDLPAEQSICIGCIRVDKSYLNSFIKHFSSYEWEIEEVTPSFCKITINYKGKVKELISLTSLLCLFMALRNKSLYLDVSKDLIRRYINIASSLSIPYYIGNLMATSMLCNRDTFSLFSTELERAVKEDVTLCMGTVADARHRFIARHLDKNLSVVDIGSGEGQYLHLSRVLEEGQTWSPIDKDEECRKQVDRKASIKSLANVCSSIECLEEWIPNGDSQALLIEVLEHNPIEEAKTLLREVLNNSYVKKVIITVPNRDFNRFYCIEEGETRHDDHEWEPSKEEMDGFIEGNIDARWYYSYEALGDVVEGITPSLGYVIERKLVHQELSLSANLLYGNE